MNYEFRNSFTLIGNISSINEIKEQSNGTKYRYFGLAQNNKYTKSDGNIMENTSFFSIKIYERDFDKFDSILEIGKYVYVQGYIKSYTDSNNKNHEFKVGRDIRDLSKDNELSDDLQDTLNELENYNWIEDTYEEPKVMET